MKKYRALLLVVLAGGYIQLGAYGQRTFVHGLPSGQARGISPHGGAAWHRGYHHKPTPKGPFIRSEPLRVPTAVGMRPPPAWTVTQPQTQSRPVQPFFPEVSSPGLPAVVVPEYTVVVPGYSAQYPYFDDVPYYY